YRQVSRKMKTLVVDDSRTMRRTVRRVLGRSMFRLDVDEASDGEAAIARVKDAGCDIVFLDANMPGLDGLGTLRRVRSIDAACRVIMLSAEREEARVQRAGEAGAVAFLHKPFFSHDIDHALHTAFGLKQPALWSHLPGTVLGNGRRPQLCPVDEDGQAITDGQAEETEAWYVEAP